MAKDLDTEGLRSIIKDYDLFFIDLWGVVHNGIKLHEQAVVVLKEIKKANKEYVLLTNAPRPNSTVKAFLDNLGMDKDIQQNVYTSGEAALSYLKKNHLKDMFFHIGPPRDFDLFTDFKKRKVEYLPEVKEISFEDGIKEIIEEISFQNAKKNKNKWKN